MLCYYHFCMLPCEIGNSMGVEWLEGNFIQNLIILGATALGFIWRVRFVNSDGLEIKDTTILRAHGRRTSFGLRTRVLILFIFFPLQLRLFSALRSDWLALMVTTKLIQFGCLLQVLVVLLVMQRLLTFRVSPEIWQKLSCFLDCFVFFRACNGRTLMK